MKPIVFQILFKGEKVDYEDVLLSTIGSKLSRIPCMKTIQTGRDSGRDYFEADNDYEIVIRIKK